MVLPFKHEPLTDFTDVANIKEFEAALKKLMENWEKNTL